VHPSRTYRDTDGCTASTVFDFSWCGRCLSAEGLVQPDQEQLKAEARGRVMIFYGLVNSEVEYALDQQLDRIEHMMFVRMRHTETLSASAVRLSMFFISGNTAPLVLYSRLI
jgi:hypothetical protein